MSKGQVDGAGAAAMLRAADRILFFLHISPDGDSIGSTLALVRATRALGKEAWAVGVDPVPRIYRFLEGWDTLFLPWDQVQGDWELGVFLDCGELHRVGAAQAVADRCRTTLNIDHHATNSLYGDYNWLDYSAAAVGEMAFRLIAELGQPLDRAMATALYTSVVMDTGMFRYESTTADTHRIAAALLEAGVRPYDVAQEIWENETVERMRLLARCLATLELHPGGRVATLLISRAVLADTGAAEEDVDGLVNYARSIAGVEVGMLLREAADGVVRVNLRSRGIVDVGQVAQAFGGGGHARAAGCNFSGSLAAARDALVAAAVAHLQG